MDTLKSIPIGNETTKIILDMQDKFNKRMAERNLSQPNYSHLSSEANEKNEPKKY